MFIPEIRDNIRKAVNPRRFEHILGVSETAAMLGSVHGEDPERCEIAGLLHDCAKCYSDDQLFMLCQNAGIVLSDEYRMSPQLIHAIYGPVEAKKYGVSDPEILDSIRCHTTGKENMTLLEQIIFVADYIEPHRKAADNLRELRILALNDLNCCTARILEQTIRYLTKEKIRINSDSLKAFQYYQKYL